MNTGQAASKGHKRFYEAYRYFTASPLRYHLDVGSWYPAERTEFERHFRVARDAYDFLEQHFGKRVHELEALGVETSTGHVAVGYGHLNEGLDGYVRDHGNAPPAEDLARFISLFLQLRPYVSGEPDRDRMAAVQAIRNVAKRR